MNYDHLRFPLKSHKNILMFNVSHHKMMRKMKEAEINAVFKI